MEELLRKLKIQSPPDGLREKALAAARAELAQPAERRDWVDRLWGARALWCSYATVVLVCLIAIFVASGDTTSYKAAAPSTNPAAVALAHEIARTLGDGPALERRLALQLSGTGATPGWREISQTELLRSIQ